MADNEEKKQKKASTTAVVESLAVVDSLNAAMVVAGAYIPAGTVVKFDYVYDPKSEEAQVYTYVALWVDNKWFLSGVGSMSRETYDNPRFAAILASEHVLSAVTLVEGESFK